jgi:glycosyltransferase involved in cell wall biosynthesis
MWSLRAANPEIKLHLVVPVDGPLSQRAAAFGVVPHLVPLPDAISRTGESHLREGRAGAWTAFARQSFSAIPTVARYVHALRSALADIRADVVHSNGIKMHLAAAAAVKPTVVPPASRRRVTANGRDLGRQPIVVWHAHDFLSTRPLTSRLLRLAARRTAGVVAVSEAVGRDVRRLLPGRLVAVVPNAIDVDEFNPSAPPVDLDALAGLSAAAGTVVRFGLVGTYAVWKGHDVFLQAAALFAARRPDLPVRFYVIGGPIYQTAAQRSETELRLLAARPELNAKVGIVPFQSDPAGVYTALDVVVHASTLPEPFGLTIVEGMACGRPVIVSAAGGAAELFSDGRDAVGVPPGDTGALAKAMETLAADSKFRRQLADEARATAVQRFDRRRLGPELLRSYAVFQQIRGNLRRPHSI